MGILEDNDKGDGYHMYEMKVKIIMKMIGLIKRI